MNLKGKKIAVLGLGSKPDEVMAALDKLGASLKIFDSSLKADEHEALRKKFQNLSKGLLSISDSESLDDIDGAILLGTPRNFEEIVKILRDRNVTILSELDFVLKATKCPVVAVTGTNGKSSVAKLIERMLVQAGKKVFLGGGDSAPILSLVGGVRYDFAVLKLSSSVLANAREIKPKIAVLTNLVPSHRERHASKAEYFGAKAKVFLTQGPQDTVIYPAENEYARTLVAPAPSTQFPFYLNKGAKHAEEVPAAYYAAKSLHLNLTGLPAEIYSLGAMKVKGWIYRANALAALATSRLLGADIASCQAVLDEFEGLPHRLQKVFEKSGISFYDDSYSANGAATAWALMSLKAPVVLIAGGYDWGEDYRKLYRTLKRRVKQLFLFGKAGERMLGQIKDAAPAQWVPGLSEAIHLAVAKAEKGDTVIFSPAAQLDPYQADAKDECGKTFLELIKTEMGIALELKRRSDSLHAGQVKI